MAAQPRYQAVLDYPQLSSLPLEGLPPLDILEIRQTLETVFEKVIVEKLVEALFLGKPPVVKGKTNIMQYS